jgi:hypothetical protein
MTAKCTTNPENRYSYHIILDFAIGRAFQGCPDDELIYQVLIASAAIPIAFPRRTMGSMKYVDGGMGVEPTTSHWRIVGVPRDAPAGGGRKVQRGKRSRSP